MKIKAVFFLCTFIFNTLVGFGCSLLMESADPHHGHIHHRETVKLSPSFIKQQVTAPGDPCCKTLVNDFLVQGKLLPDYTKLNLKAPALVPLGLSFAFIPETKIVIKDQREISQHRYRPPHPDIRVVIQSFQI